MFLQKQAFTQHEHMAGSLRKALEHNAIKTTADDTTLVDIALAVSYLSVKVYFWTRH
jgi:hypothetical protein